MRQTTREEQAVKGMEYDVHPSRDEVKPPRLFPFLASQAGQDRHAREAGNVVISVDMYIAEELHFLRERFVCSYMLNHDHRLV